MAIGLKRLWILLGSMLLVWSGIHATPVWPTSGKAFNEGQPWSNFVQPTESNFPFSGLFGSTREEGARFHEGVDIRAESWDTSGIADDRIYAFLPGQVVYVNRDAAKSSYGKYVVVEHVEESPSVYSLYAHLDSVGEAVQPGVWVEAGSVLGKMGRSAGGYEIPEARAHLHFEIGLRLTDDFQAWYDKQEFDDKNDHGLWNGMNLIGFNPLKYLGRVRARGEVPMDRYIREELPTDFSLRIFTQKVPDFIKRYPELLTRSLPLGGVAGWDVAFTWYGFPKRWTALPRVGIVQRKGVEILRFREEPMFRQSGRQTLVKDAEGRIQIGKHLEQFLELLFGEPML